MDDIKFIRDERQEKSVKQLQEILDVLKVRPRDTDVEAATRFFYAMLKSAQGLAEKKKKEREEALLKKAIEEKKKEEIKPTELEPSMYKILKEIKQPKIPLPEISKIPKLEEFKPEEESVEEAIENVSKSYPLILFKNIKGETIAQINILHEKGKIVYELMEPEIDSRLVGETKKLVQKKFQKDKKIIKNEKFLTKNIKKAFKKLKIDYTEDYKEEIKYFLYKDMLGLGRIDPLIHDPNVKTVMCDGLNKPVKITLGPGLEITTNIIYMKKENLDEQIEHLGLRIKQEISENNPIAEGMFYNFKIQATLGLGEAESKFMIRKMP